ncbi:MAG: fructose-1,6-bisphosphatase [Paludibacteraceae bacterium]|nr:fructose-1,6-bisphosphatase [Paludibacteraceae bacterium]
MIQRDATQDERYLRLLSEKFPSRRAAATEIINLKSIISLPKGTEHFVSDLHGNDEAFIHLIKNASGVIRKKVDDIFGENLTEQEKRELCALIYYPNERLKLERSKYTRSDDLEAWYKLMIFRTIEVARKVTVKYSRSKVRKRMPKEFAYVIDELLFESPKEPGRKDFYDSIVDSVIETGLSEQLIVAICFLIHKLSIDTLHVVGDVYDRGPGADKIMDALMGYHDFDIQWGNHDMEWMGAACGNRSLIATTVRVSTRFANVDTLEEGYGISLLPLATFAIDTYGDDPCEPFIPEDHDDNIKSKRSAELLAKMHKAISIIQFKLEGQLIMRHPEYEMDDRLLLDKIDKEKGTIMVYGKEYPLRDKNLPTLDPEHPYELTAGEELVMSQLEHSFLRSEKMQQHLRLMFQHGSLYLVQNGFLLYHAAVPMTADGEFMPITYDGKRYAGRALMDFFDKKCRQAYYEKDADAIDLMWYMWCGFKSPLFNKDKMTTLERYFVADKDTHTEITGSYFKLADKAEICKQILKEFGLPTETGRIINGHIPVKTIKGEQPMRANGKRLVIDGGFARAYHAKTGISGYTLIYNSQGIQLIEHEMFESKEQAVISGSDIHSRVQLKDFSDHRMLIKDTERGQELQRQIDDLERLIQAYKEGIIPEKY